MSLSITDKRELTQQTFKLYYRLLGFSLCVPSFFINEQDVNNFVGVNDNKEYYLVTTKHKTKYDLLRPEMTFISTKEFSDLNNAVYYYAGYCFRHERKQYCRFREFVQLGIEGIFLNEYKTRIYSFLSLLSIDKLLGFFCNNDIKIKCEICLKTEEAQQYKDLISKCLNYVKPTYLSLERLGSDLAVYTHMTYEYHFFYKHTWYEILGGGEYIINRDNKQYFGSGFSTGAERLTEAGFDYQKIATFLQNNYGKIVQEPMIVYISTANSIEYNVTALYNLLAKYSYDNMPHIQICFTNKKNKSWIGAKDTDIIL